MTDPLVWVRDELVPASAATVSVYDRAFRAGEGVFETMRAYGPVVFRLERHLDRCLAGARTLRFEPPDRGMLRDAVEQTVRANGGDGAARLTLSPGPIDPASPFPGVPVDDPLVVVTFHQLRDLSALWRDGVTAVTVPWGREVPGVKAVSYVASSLARRHAREAGADEALFTDESDHVLEASTANVFAVVGGDLITPPVDAGLLPGVTRQAVLEVAEAVGLDAVERALPLDTLARADEAFLTASTRELVPLVGVNGGGIGPGSRGPVTERLQRAYRSLVASETGPV